MFRSLTRTETSSQRDSKNAVFFLCAWLLVGVYLYLVGPHTLVWHQGQSRILWLGLFAMTFAPPLYTLYLWLRRTEMIPLDRHMMYLPLVIWYGAFLLVQSVMWSLFHGRAAWGPYGGDKSLANGLVESMLVLSLSGVYLLRFPLSRGPGAAKTAGVSIAFFVLVGVLAVVVAIVVPPLPE